jgi:hypothetical protein
MGLKKLNRTLLNWVKKNLRKSYDGHHVKIVSGNKNRSGNI